ncbi:Sel1 repeat family protein [Pelagibacter phage Eistla EXVC025P]|nr:Sel1 repeat family protein [Pelagibacter phage Eistla EXVC025P]
MVKQVKAIKAILTQHHADKFKDTVNKSTFLANYAKETDKVKKIEMLRQAAQEGWI